MVQSSCGMSVPYYAYQTDREVLAKSAVKQGKSGIEKYWIKKNKQSIDGFDTEIVKRSALQEE